MGVVQDNQWSMHRNLSSSNRRGGFRDPAYFAARRKVIAVKSIEGEQKNALLALLPREAVVSLGKVSFCKTCAKDALSTAFAGFARPARSSLHNSKRTYTLRE